MVKRLLFLLLAFCTFSLPVQAATSSRILIHVKPTMSLTTFRDALDDTLSSDGLLEQSQRKAIYEDALAKIKVISIEVPSGSESLVLQTLSKMSMVEYAESDATIQALGTANDPRLAEQWGLPALHVTGAGLSAWDSALGTGVKVAVVDTGVDISHPDLVGQVAESVDVLHSGTVLDQNGHGTHIAGIIAASMNNSEGGAGVAPKSELLNVKVLDGNGSGYYSDIAAGIIWAADHGAQVINLSLGGSADVQTLGDAVDYAYTHGSSVVAAAGNSGNSKALFPARYPHVLGITAIDSELHKPTWAAYGEGVDFAAPGVSILSTYSSNKYVLMTGSSMSSGYVSGVAALLYSPGYCTTTVCVENALIDSATGKNSYWNYGIVQANEAVQDVNTASPTPTITPTSTPEPTPTPTSIPTATPTPDLTATPTSTPEPTPAPSQPAQKQLQIASQKVTTSNFFLWRSVLATIVVKDTNGTPIKGAQVSGRLVYPSGIDRLSSLSTNKNGVALLQYNFLSEKGTYTFQIRGVSKSGYTPLAEQSVEQIDVQ